MNKILLKVENLKKSYEIEKKSSFNLFKKDEKKLNAVNDINFYIRKGETVSIVGETGCGKTTTGKMTLRLIEPTEGNVFYNDENILLFDNRKLKKFRRNAQIIHQNPFASLNPRKTIENNVGLPLEVYKIAFGNEKRDKVSELLERVGLIPASDFIDRHPHEFSGGQRQRVVIARAIALNPEYIVADEPVASLDVSIRAQILNLLQDIKKTYNLTYLFIAHDLSVIRFISNRVLVMYLGKLVEISPVKELFESPLHPYTKALISSSSILDITKKREILRLKGELPSAINPPSGCQFHTRCPFLKNQCRKIEPELIKIDHEHYVACHLYY